MSNHSTISGDFVMRKGRASTLTSVGILFRTGLALLALLAVLPLAQAQSLNFNAIPPVLTTNLYVGANFSGAYTNLQFRANISAPLDPSNPVTYTAAGAPAGVTITFSGTGTTNSVTNNVTVAVTNVAAGIYPITITATTNGIQFDTASLSFNLLAGNLWTNPVAGGNWSTPANWSTGLPGANDNVMFQDVGALNPGSNFVDSTITIGSFNLIRNQGSTTNDILIANGATLAVAGSNGFYMNQDATTLPANNKGMRVRIAGSGGAQIVVTNQNANYAINGESTGAIGVNSGTTLTMTNLDNQFVSVNRVGFGDASLMDRGAVIAEMVLVELAKTNVFIASYSNSFTGPAFTNSIQCFNQYEGSGSSAFSSGNAMELRLGISNIFMADSMRIGGNANQGNSLFRFASPFTNGILPIAKFCSTNGGRMSFFGIAVQSGVAANNRFDRAQVLLNQGITDLKADIMWLAVNRTNDSSGVGGNPETATLTFGGTTNGTSVVDVNTLIAGNQLYTNNANCIGNINVQTNALLVVNNYLELGHSVGDTNVPLNAVAAQTRGTLTLSGGIARINQINVGDFSTNNQVVLQTGSQLVVSNTIASPAKSLSVLNVNGAKINFRVTAGVTNAFVTNLVSGAAATVVNIDSLTGFSPTVPATNVIIAYQDNLASHNLVIGSLPTGFNNISLIDNVANKTIELRIATNAPAVLKWRGGANSNWDHTSLNWQNTNTLAITRFFDGDSVIFDDSAVVPTSISVTEVINPGQVGTGIYVSNSVNAFTFTDGGGSIGNCSLVKDGPNDLTVSAVTSATAQINNGTLKGSSPGAVGGTTIASGASMNFGGTINGPLQAAGKATLASGGIAANTVQVLNGGVLTNSGSIQGNALTLDSGSFLYNATNGTLLSIGSGNSVNVATNATLVNEGNIGAENQANTLTVNGTFKDLGVGNIFLTTLTINGGSTFLPGGDGIGTTSIKSALVGSGFPGRMTLLAGSTTLIKVDFANAQTNTIVKAQYTDFGGNTAVKSFDGATILMTNVNTGAGVFAAGQSFRVFQNSDPGAPNGNIGNEGAGTTNRYPIVTPIIPAANTKWDLTNLRDTDPNGFINLVTFPTTGTNITFAAFRDSSNIVSHLQWPSEYIGWRLQELTNDLTSTNWITIGGSATNNDVYITNDAAIDETFFRMIYP